MTTNVAIAIAGFIVGMALNRIYHKAKDWWKKEQEDSLKYPFVERKIYDRERAFLQFLTVISITLSLSALIISMLRLLWL